MTTPPTRGIKLSRSVRDAISPPIPKAQAWAATYTPPTYSSLSNSHSDDTSPAEKDDGQLLNLSQGVPGDPPHPLLLAELAKTSADPRSAGYGPILGERSLREAVTREMEYVYRFSGDVARKEDGERVMLGDGAHVDAIGEEGTAIPLSEPIQRDGPPTWEEVAITSGCNQAFFNTVMALCERGDKVMIPVPWYFNMLMTFQILGIQPLPLPLDPRNSFLPSLSDTQDLLSSPAGQDVKLIVLVTPNNPTGTTYPSGLIEGFADLAREKGVVLLVDETYRDFVRPAEGREDLGTPGRPHTLFEREDWRSHVITIGSFSKSYKIPGHRLGYIVASEEVLVGVTTVADCIQICAPRPPQLALAPLLPTLRKDLSDTSLRLHTRLQLFSQLVCAVRGWSVSAQGGFFSYVRHPYVQGGKAVPSEVVSEVLAKRCGVITLPGSFFMPERASPEWRALEEQASPLVEDRWIRFAVANVSDEVVRKVPGRLELLNGLADELGWTVEDD